MKLPKLTIRRAIVLGFLLLVAAAAIAPYLRADRFRQRIQAALEASLERRVEIEEVRFSLFRGPGFSLRKVVIYDDPAAGVEPFAYVDSVDASLRLASVWTGRLQFSSLRLVAPSVNLLKTAAGPWNFQPLLSRAAGADLPEFHVRGGRLNFKFGDVKSVFYFTDADLDIEPPSGPGRAFRLEFSGEPARTDRAAYGFGKLGGRGRWYPSRDREGRLQLDLDLEKSAVSELVTLTHGHDIGVHGSLGARARLSGPISDLKVTGDLQLEDIHRWDLMPPYAHGGPLSYQGRLDLLSQHIELETVPTRNSTLSVRFRASDYLSQPHWAVSLTLKQLPLEPLVDVARHMGIPIPAPVQMDGRMDGVIGYSPEGGFQGQVQSSDARARIPGALPVRFQQAELLLDGSRVRLSSAAVSADDAEMARMEVDYLADDRRLDLKITTAGLSIAALRSEAGPLLGMAQLPFLEIFQGGTWDGWLRYRSEGETPGHWSGDIHLRETQLSVSGVADPFVVEAAKVSLAGDRVTVTVARGRLGELEIQGEYRYRPGAIRPHQFHCRTAELEAAQLERLLAPALRRRQGFLSRTLGLGRTAVPKWLKDWHATGTLEVGAFSLAELKCRNLTARLFWDATDLEVTSVAAQFEDGRLMGRLSVNLSGQQPSYEWNGRIQSMNWQGGKLDVDGSLNTAGAGADLFANLHVKGSFTGRSVALGPDLRFSSASGCYDLAWTRGRPRLGLQALRFETGQRVFLGNGATLDDGRLQIELTGDATQMRLVGGLTPLQLEVMEPHGASEF